tara:strand:- start:9653 stop:10333 length:681 start_codon:yes stop_codon:yes gene_type:complete
MWLFNWLTKLSLAYGIDIIKSKGFRKKLKRKEEPIEIVLHESVTSTWKTAYKVLNKRKLSVHFTVEKDGVIRQHVDPVKYYTIHAGGKHNKNSVSIEVINRYYGKKNRDDVIKTCWAHKKYYILPPLDQCEAVWQLCLWLDVQFESDLLDWPCTDLYRFKWGRNKPNSHKRGIKAHHRWHHSDGLFIEHYTLMRFRGYKPKYAYRFTIESAESGNRVTDLPKPQEV